MLLKVEEIWTFRQRRSSSSSRFNQASMNLKTPFGGGDNDSKLRTHWSGIQWLGEILPSVQQHRKIPSVKFIRVTMIHGQKRKSLSAPLNWSETWFDNKGLWRMPRLKWNTQHTAPICTDCCILLLHSCTIGQELSGWHVHVNIQVSFFSQLLLTMCYALSGKCREGLLSPWLKCTHLHFA